MHCVDNILLILLIVAAIKFVVFGGILLRIFRKDIQQYWRERSEARTSTPESPRCMYCQSLYTEPVDEGQTRWEDDSLVLVTTYECQHCHLPFWNVERVAVGSLRS